MLGKYKCYTISYLWYQINQIIKINLLTWRKQIDNSEGVQYYRIIIFLTVTLAQNFIM